MEQPLKVNFLSGYINLWREKIKTFVENVFSPPYLQTRFIWFFLITILTHFSVIITNYSLTYWHHDFSNTGIAPSSVSFEMSPSNWLMFLVIYLPIAIFCLIVFNFRWSLIGWLTAEIIHFWAMGNFLDGCSYNRWSILMGKFCDSFDTRVYWMIVAALLGIMISTYTNPSFDSAPRQQIKKKLPRFFIISSVMWSFLLIFTVIASAQKSDYGWQRLELEVTPPPLENAAYAYDTKDNQLLVFGGIIEYKDGRPIYSNQTWLWDGTQWKNVTPPIYISGSPRFRTNASMAYDEQNDKVVLYGGFYNDNGLCDTWIWNGESWLWVCPPNCPGARFAHEMYYDSIRKKVILYGGYNGKTFLNDAWEWDGYTWTQIEIEGDSPIASGYALAYTPDEQFALALLSGIPGGTWIFQDNQWTELHTEDEPSNRGGMALVYEPERKSFVTFGGYSGNHTLNETWVFDGLNWNRFISKSQPPIRSNLVMWYDEVRKHIMIFGGRSNIGTYNDTWEFIFP